MKFQLPPLPFAPDDLEPVIPKETIEYHYGKHHKKYVDTLNELIAGTPDESRSLLDLIRTTEGKIFNNAAQVWNHTFYWHCLNRPAQAGKPSPALAKAIEKSFGSQEAFEKELTQVALNTFGSGWAWAVKDGDAIRIVSTKDAMTPVRDGKLPILTCDVWEHAYYIDYRNDRAKYLESFRKAIHWDFVSKRFEDNQPFAG